MQKKKKWFGTAVKFQSVALLDELMVKLKICYKIRCNDYFHNGHSSSLNMLIYTMW
jgi:hypothetical protein